MTEAESPLQSYVSSDQWMSASPRKVASVRVNGATTPHGVRQRAGPHAELFQRGERAIRVALNLRAVHSRVASVVEAVQPHRVPGGHHRRN